MERLRLPLASLVFLLLYRLFVCFFLRVKCRKLLEIPVTVAIPRIFQIQQQQYVTVFLVQHRFWDNQTRVQVEISLQVAVAMES